MIVVRGVQSVNAGEKMGRRACSTRIASRTQSSQRATRPTQNRDVYVMFRPACNVG
jgi:hypothetical protein